MLTVFRGFRAALTIVLAAIFAALVLGAAIELAGDHGVLTSLAQQMDQGFSPINVAENVPGFWTCLWFAVGLASGLWLDVGLSSLRRQILRRAARSPLQILYHPDDHRFVRREYRNGQLQATTCVSIAIRNGMIDKPLTDVVVSAGNNALVRAIVAPAWGGTRTCHISRIEPNAIAFVEIVGLPEEAPADAAKLLSKPRRLVVRARSKDGKRATARFKFDARAEPILQRLS
jgi:hypothetical protein